MEKSYREYALEHLKNGNLCKGYIDYIVEEMDKLQKVEQMLKKWNSGEYWEDEALLDCEFIERLSDVVLGEKENDEGN